MVMGQYAMINGRHALKTVLKHYGVILVDYTRDNISKKGLLYTRYTRVYSCYPRVIRGCIHSAIHQNYTRSDVSLLPHVIHRCKQHVKIHVKRVYTSNIHALYIAGKRLFGTVTSSRS